MIVYWIHFQPVQGTVNFLCHSPSLSFSEKAVGVFVEECLNNARLSSLNNLRVHHNDSQGIQWCRCSILFHLPSFIFLLLLTKAWSAPCITNLTRCTLSDRATTCKPLVKRFIHLNGEIIGRISFTFLLRSKNNATRMLFEHRRSLENLFGQTFLQKKIMKVMRTFLRTS